MIGGYVVVGLIAIVLLLVAYVRLIKSKLDKSEANYQSALETIESSKAAIAQQQKTGAAVKVVQEKLTAKHRRELAGIEAGERNHFDTDGF